MCLVEVEGAPTLQISCNTRVAEGQTVRVYSDEALKARESVLEFLLINHPLDCPICDQAGECELQNYVFREGRSRTRFTPTYAKRFNPVEDFGPDVLYVPNRCILCTRCVRFMEDVADEPVLNVSERGDRAYIGVHPDRELDHAWSGNVVDLCPVGSLISKDFLHKARAWETDKTPSICTGCSQGCNVTLETRTDAVVRLRPRSNLSVNHYYLCDHGRSDYRWMNLGDRIEAPLVRVDDELVATDWDHALARAAEIVGGSAGTAVSLVSPRASNEALFLLADVLRNVESRGAFRVAHAESEHPLPGVANLALRRERAPNATGARLLGFGEDFAAAIEQAAEAGLVVVLDEPLTGVDPATLQGAGNVIYLGTVMSQAMRGAELILPITNTAEEDGSFVNRDHRVQRYLQAKSGPGMARPAWWVLGEVLVELGRGEPVGDAAEAFERVAAGAAPFADLSYDQIGYHGVVVAGGRPAEVSV
jgi:NADH-quinone oxidoreductase subunit G